AGSLAGAVFFQIAGQLMARGVVMKRGGMPFGAVVVVTLYERLVAAVLSCLIAIFGALYVFGRVYLDPGTGGIELIKLACGLVAAIAFAAWLGFGSIAIQNFGPFLTRRFVVRLLRVVGLTLAVQLPMMGAYVAVAHEFSPATPIGDLVAASAIVMFAASVPISLAGWGVRELSAVVALGAIGVAASDALTAAVIIGAGSMLAMAFIAIVSFQAGAPEKVVTEAAGVRLVDYARALAWILPITAAVFVFFQVYVPIGSGLLNVNLADPVAILAGSLFVLRAIKDGQLPQWRVGYINLFAAIATLALAFSLLLGASRFGWTNWALVNRFLGWFVLLAFAATGALITSVGGARAFRIFVLTYVGASAGVMLVETGLIYMRAIGVPHLEGLVWPGNLQAFAQNHNFFAFQLLMAAAGALVMLRDERLRKPFLVLLLVTVWFAGSRSGWGALVCLLGAGVYLGIAKPREIFIGTGIAVILVAAAILLSTHDVAELLSAGLGGADGRMAPNIVLSGVSTQERLVTLIGGWQLFLEYPIFGAGLGAFRNQMILSTSGIPLVVHSTALWLLAELGLIGFLVFAVPGAYVWITEWRCARREQAAAVIALCFVGFAVMSGPADMVYQRTFWLMAGAALVVPRLNDSRDSGSSIGKAAIISAQVQSAPKVQRRAVLAR
ncbi:MAG: lysylphosphatidylglycerol synthase domain-containing protein, partial [Sulfuritalea sp.]|nr:lysylphosphatidylglycerol synthase domain-containing protein [Sulfuritalea sp.]